MKRKEQTPVKSTLDRHYQKTNCAAGVRAWHWYHFENCVECGRLLQGERPVLETLEVIIDGTPVTVTCSLPTSSLPYNFLRKYLSGVRSVEGPWAEFNCPGVTSLSYWIFHPSHRDDPRKCLLNYHHVMQEKNEVAGYVQVAVVRSERFQAYSSTWGKMLAIIQLPDKLPNCELGPSEGGVGYARLFIQKIAFALRLEYVFVIDDNVALMSEAVFRSDDETTTGQSVVRDENGVMKMERCSFLKPLSYLQKIVKGKGNPPDQRIKYEPHSLKEQPEGQQFPLYTYTGPAKLFGDKPFKSYGILGLLRSVPITVRPFAKTQVYAAVLLNVKSTVEKKVFYRPWPCWEDLRFNDDCDKADLWVVKCNLFRFHKVQYNDWIKDLALPSIFEWKEDTTLEERPLDSKLPRVSEEGIILDHLHSLVNTKGPEKCLKVQIGYDRPEDSEDHLSPTRIIERLDLQNYESSEIPVLIVSYSVANRMSWDMMRLNSAFCAAQENIIIITSAEDAIQMWPGMTLATILSKYGICFFSEMIERCGQFSILSAADPRRHRLRWIVIEASFLKEEGIMLGEFDATVERNYSENVTNAEKSILLDHQQQFSEESTKTSEKDSPSTKSQETVDLRTSSQPPFRNEPGLKEFFSASRSPCEIPCLKRTFQVKTICQTSPTVERHGEKSLQGIAGVRSSLLPLHTSGQESPNAKLGTIQDSPSKRRKIEDYFGQKDEQKCDEPSVKETFENGGTGGETFSGKKVKRKKICVDVSGERNSKENEQGEAISEKEQSKGKKKKKLKTESSQKSTNPIHPGVYVVFRDKCDVDVVKEKCGKTSSGGKVKRKKNGAEDRGERNRKGSEKSEATLENEQSKARKKKKKEFKTEDNLKSMSPTHSSQSQGMMSKNEDDKQRASTSSLHDEDDVNVENESNASSQTSMTSVYSIQWEDTEWSSVPETYGADDVESNNDSNTSHLSSRTSTLRHHDAEKMSSVYMEGTNEVTAVIVNLWIEHKRMKREDLSMDYVQNSLAYFKNVKLETKDNQGYNALLKACSLPSMSPHVMQHLIVGRKVDLNCTLPHDFDKHHPSAKGLIPGMSALSVAIRRKNISCISTFKRREAEINVRGTDQEGNTALHHCVVSKSKFAFQKLFPLYKPLNWTQMFNSKNDSPLDIARNLAQDNAAKKKQALEYILEEMEGKHLSHVLSVKSSDEEVL